MATKVTIQKPFIVVVTGAGSGIGRAVCKLFASKGVSVAAADINEDAAKETVAMLDGENRSPHKSFLVDITKGLSVTDLADQVQSSFGRVPNSVVHCAGVLSYFDGLLSCEESRWNSTISVNLTGTFLVNKVFIGRMVAAGTGGAIVNFSSTASGGSPGCPDYSAAKAGVEGLTKTAAKEFAKHGIRVNAVQPGAVQTPLLSGLDESKLKLIVSKTPLGRVATPEEIAKLCYFLATDESSYITGVVHQISGGFSW